MESGGHGGRPWLHGDELSVRFVESLGRLMEVAEILEHLADHLLPRADHQTHHVVAQCVSVLVKEPLNVVPHLNVSQS